MRPLVIHCIANAHLDPVWLWDWRDGLAEGIITCRTMLDLMDEDPEFTFVRGEAAIYRHIAEHDPATFARIAARIAEGRWDVVGGTWLQADTNLPGTETFVRQYLHGQRWLAQRFGRPVRVAWAADSFGHAAGLPDIMAGAGIEGFFFTRPEASILPLPLPAFWWEGHGGNRVLSYRPLAGWYGSERHEVAPKLDKLLEIAREQPLVNVGFFYGLGNHGGGASRRHLAEIRAWRERHPEVRVVHSGLHQLHDAIAAEVRSGLELPTQCGEMNFTLRGCYASVAKFKWPYRRAEAQIAAAETLDALASTAVGSAPANLEAAWQAILFSSFHDILPGSSIERAYDDQAAWLGTATHRCLEVESAALTALAARIDTRVPAVSGDHPQAVPMLVWNPHPQPFQGHVELEANLDYRLMDAYRDRAAELPVEVRDADGRVLPHQVIENEHHFAPDMPWRKRVVVPVAIPALGWSVMSLGWVEGAQNPQVAGPRAAALDPLTIGNGRWRVSATLGAAGIHIERDGVALCHGDGLQFAVFADAAGSWGGNDGPTAIDLRAPSERWTVTLAEVREHGPERAALWVRLTGARSHVDLAITLLRGRDAVDVQVRLLWNERDARLRLLLPAAVASATYEVIGGTASRSAVGDVPGLSWARVSNPEGGFGFASDALSSFTVAGGIFSATLVRSSPYAYSHHQRYPASPWWPVADRGELRCRFALCPAETPMPAFASMFATPPLAQIIPASVAVEPALPRRGSFASIAPTSLRLLALKPAADGAGLVLRVQETTGQPVVAVLECFGVRLALGTVAPFALASWRLVRSASAWTAIACDLLERPLPVAEAVEPGTRPAIDDVVALTR